jgi:ribonuclease HI
LGWDLSSDKLLPYDSVCKVLGVKFDLKMSGDGISLVLNTEDRVSELCESLDEILGTRRLKRAEGEKLRGRLIFAAGQLFGRFVRNQIRLLSDHIRSGRANLTDETVSTLQGIRHHLHANVPRKIVGSSCDHVHIYVDASFDDGSYSGIGGVIYDNAGKPLSFFSEELSQDFLDVVRCDGQVTVIQELEMLALLVAVCLWCPEFKNYRVVAFTDSESVRGAFLKTWSNNLQNSHLLAHVFQVEEECLCQIWLERVPSQSNPSDHLSREKVRKWMGLVNQQVDYKELWNRAALLRGKCAA